MEQLAITFIQLVLIIISICAAAAILHVRSDDYFEELLLDSTYSHKEIKNTQNGIIILFVIVIIVSLIILSTL